MNCNENEHSFEFNQRNMFNNKSTKKFTFFKLWLITSIYETSKDAR